MPGGEFALEYVTGAVSMIIGDGIVIHVTNDNQAEAITQLIIYQNTGTGAIIKSDSGSYPLVPTWMGGASYTIQESGEYWVRILSTSEFVIPQVSFDRLSEPGLNPDTLSYSISPPFERSRLPHGVAQPRRGSRYRCNTVLSSRTRSLRSASFTRVGFLGADR